MKFGGLEKLMYLCVESRDSYPLLRKYKIMIAEFTIKNFSSVRTEQTLSFVPEGNNLMEEEYFVEVAPNVKLLKMGVIYGANASGKSNILRAIDFFRKLMTYTPASKSESLDFMPFLFDDISSEEKSSMSMTVWINGHKYILSVEYDRNKIYTETLSTYKTNRRSILYKRTYNAENDVAEVEFSASTRLTKADQKIIAGNTIPNCTVLAAFGKSNVGQQQLKEVSEYFTASMTDLLTPRKSLDEMARTALMNDHDGRLKKFILYFLRASDFNITDLHMLDKSHISFAHQTEAGVYEMGESMESSGTMRLLGMSVLLYSLLSGNRFMEIDEIENSIHFELVSYFLKCFLANSEGQSQLLVTTHDINLLNEDFLRRDVVWFTDKNNEGETILERLSSMGVHKNISPYNAYRQGKLIKLPFLDSIFFNLSILPNNESK